MGFVFSGFFVPEENGEHFATVTCQETGASLVYKDQCSGAGAGKNWAPGEYGIAERNCGDHARGKMVSADQLQELMNAIKDLPEPEPQIKRIRLWAHPIWAGTMILLLGLFWVGRKLVGFI